MISCRLKSLLMLLVWLIAAQASTAQTIAPCKTGLAEATLGVNNVIARILNTGGLFWRGSPNLYEVPRGSGVNAIFTAGIWIGGLVDDTLRVAGTTYGPYEFWPGPHDLVKAGINCNVFDRIYNVTTADIRSMERGEDPSRDVREWPWQFGAPVIDGDGVPGNYDLAAGDRPEVLGNQSLFWIMNDVGGEHVRTGSPQMGIEVHATAFATTDDSNEHLPNTTFYRYRIFNRNEVPIRKAYFEYFQDADLGNFDDDYVGSDSTLNLSFTYNADNLDEGRFGYGEAPPAVGFQVLQSPLATSDDLDNDDDGFVDEEDEMLGITSFVFYPGGGGFQGSPGDGADMYNYMQGLWKNGDPVTVGGDGWGFSNIRTSFMFPANPPEFWSEFDADNQGNAIQPSDRRSLSAVGPFNIEPGDYQEIFFAITTAFGNDNLDSVQELKKAAMSLQGLRPETVPAGRANGPPSDSPLVHIPGNGAQNQPLDLSISWVFPGPGMVTHIQISDDPEFTQPMEFVRWGDDQLVALESNTEYFVRVRMRNVDGYGPFSPITTFSTGSITFVGISPITEIVAVSNAAGPIEPPIGASADFRGFPGTRARANETQQVGPGKWMIATAMSEECVTANCGDFTSFLAHSIGYRSTALQNDWEFRFDDQDNQGFRLGDSSGITSISFSVWRIGMDTPEDPSDDVRFLVAWKDLDGDGEFGLNPIDHTASGGSNDPFTDWIYVYEPSDLSPGSVGYETWLAESSSGGLDVDGSSILAGDSLFSQVVFFNWNGGDVSGGTLDEVNQLMPESGTTFRIDASGQPGPIPSFPVGGQLIDASEATYHWWARTELAGVLEVSTGEDFSNIVFSAEFPESGQISSPALPPGRYFWRVTDLVGFTSAVEEFEIGLATAVDEVLPEHTTLLYANYPNPFRGSTTISFSLRSAEHVNLEVYDMIGRRVASLVNTALAPGDHSVQFDASGLSSGIYMYRLKTGHRSESRVLTVIN